MRRGQWTTQEIAYATRLIDEFRNGSLQIPGGTSMRGFLAEKLGCAPKRVSKKYENTNYNGRLLYAPNKSLSAEVCVRTRLELETLERAFRESVQKSKSAKAAAKKHESQRKSRAEAPSVAATRIGNQSFAQPKEDLSPFVRETSAVTPGASSVAGAHSRLVQTSNQLQALVNLEQALQGNTFAATVANDELHSLLAVRQSLAQQNLQSILRQEDPGRSNALSTATCNNQLLALLSPFQQPQPKLPSTHNTMASQMERLLLLRQIEQMQIEQQQQQQLLLSPTAPAPTTLQLFSTQPSVPVNQLDTLLFQDRAVLLAQSQEEDSKLSSMVRETGQASFLIKQQDTPAINAPKERKSKPTPPTRAAVHKSKPNPPTKTSVLPPSLLATHEAVINAPNGQANTAPEERKRKPSPPKKTAPAFPPDLLAAHEAVLGAPTVTNSQKARKRKALPKKISALPLGFLGAHAAILNAPDSARHVDTSHKRKRPPNIIRPEAKLPRHNI